MNYNDLIVYNKGFIFSFSGSDLKIENNNSLHYYYFNFISPIKIKKINAIYDKDNDNIILYYNTNDSFNYIKLDRCSYYFNLETKSYKYVIKDKSDLELDLDKLIQPEDDYGNFKLYIKHNFDVNFINFYEYDEANSKIKIYYKNEYEGLKVDFIFDSIYGEETNGTTKEFYIVPPLIISIDICSFSCDICFNYYNICNIDDCPNIYSYISNSNYCYPKSQLYKNYIYNSTTNYFEKFFFSCEFCSLMGSLSTQFNQNCLSCSEGYLKSYKYIGNCYKINNDDIYLDKIINNQFDEKFSIVSSCKETLKKYKINSTKECVFKCPNISIYKKYEYKYFNLSISQYLETNEIIPKYNYGNLCLETCPVGTEADDLSNKCIDIKNNEFTEEFPDIKSNEYIDKFPYIILKNNKFVNFCPITELLEKTCKINNIFGVF